MAEVGQNQLDALGDSAGTGAGFLDTLTNNPELVSIILDAIGSKVDPQNPFAGVGTTIAKSKLAARAEEESASKEAKLQEMIGGLVKSMTGKDEPGPTTFTLSKDPSGGYVYNVKGFEQGERRLDQAGAVGADSAVSPAAPPAAKTEDDFLKDFGGL